MRARLRELGIDVATRTPRRLLAEDLIWRPPAAEWQLVHEEVSWARTPVSLVRSQYMQHRSVAQSSLTLRLSLCCNGWTDGLALLERYALSFERVVPPDAVVGVTDTWALGDFGVAWSWSRSQEPDVLAFLRHNLLAVFEGRDAASRVRPLAQTLDGALRRLRTVDAYSDEGAGTEERGQPPCVVQVPAHEELDLNPILGEDGASLCFFPPGGPAVFDRSTRRWVFHAGGERGRIELTFLRAGAGILPARERLVVEIS